MPKLPLTYGIEITEAGTKESLSDPVIPKPPFAALILDSRKTTAPQPRNEASPSREPQWRDINMSFFEFLETPFKRVPEDQTNLHNQYFRLEHITQDVSMALDNCGPKNILRELAKKMDRSKVNALETEKAQLAAHVAAMT